MTQKNDTHRILRIPIRFFTADKAVSALEYAMVVGIVAIAVGAAIVAFSDDYKAPISAVAGRVGAITTQAINVTP